MDQFQRAQKRSSVKGKLPKLDGSSKWQSSYKMTRIATESWHLWSDIFAQAPADHPSLIPVDHKQSIEDIVKCFELDATIAILQKDDALLAEYLPVI